MVYTLMVAITSLEPNMQQTAPCSRCHTSYFIDYIYILNDGNMVCKHCLNDEDNYEGREMSEEKRLEALTDKITRALEVLESGKSCHIQVKGLQFGTVEHYRTIAEYLYWKASKVEEILLGAA